jgi:cytidine deaminase
LPERTEAGCAILAAQEEPVELSDPRCEDALRDAAEARRRAYAPYSRFRMGAAVVTDRDAVIPGALVENVSLGLAMCAERIALFGTVAQGAGRPEILALVAPRTRGHVTCPCGACLQVAMELGGPELIVVAADPKGAVEKARLSDLAPRLPFKGP